ncbi:hypothetical protein ASJ81_16430 [Methanosarcina spelaei]|uniref:Uncharacterized protein n=1 Tax=Methanosarcina spelaei TaxID=1036679 RepID=A0A2A2HX16_9EURY|nr:hypothetical protein [Methanosarcina spelaei]PAV13790.1 hypothetical protein ASJ81_16430 [Methanosarcina spelaei]
MRDDDGVEGRGFSKKRMSICNGLNRGSNFALILKDADLLMILLCERKQIHECNIFKDTNSEKLTDSNVRGLLSRITKSDANN